MRLSLHSRLARTIARMVCWVMLALGIMNAAQACLVQGPRTAPALLQAAVTGDADQGPAAPCHAGAADDPAPATRLGPEACQTLCDAPQGAIAKAKDGDPAQPDALPAPSGRGFAPPAGTPLRSARAAPPLRPPSAPVAILFLRLTI